jgi:hypothetical protein
VLVSTSWSRTTAGARPPHKRPPTAPTPSYAAPGERTNTQLKTWHIPANSAAAPGAGQIAKAIHVLQTVDVGG